MEDSPESNIPPINPSSHSASSLRMLSEDEPNTTTASPRVPIEIVDHILKLALNLSQQNYTTRKFSSIASFALASTTFRQIALRSYFRDITPETKAHWAGLCRMLGAQDEREIARGGKGAFSWVRYVYAYSSRKVRKVS